MASSPSTGAPSAGAPSAGAAPADTPWRGLHSASLAVNLLPQTWRTLRGLWPLLLFVLLPGRSQPLASDLLLLLVLLGTSVASTAIHFFTLRYRFHDGRLEIRSGLLNRRARTVDPARIQNLSLVQNPFHKLAGLVELRIDMAGDPSSDGLLSALSLEEAEALRDALERARGRSPEGAEAEAPPILTQSLLEITAFGLSQRRLGAIALLAAVSSELMNVAAPTDTAAITRSLGPRGLLAVFLLALAGSWVLGALGAWLRHGGFRLLRTGDRLVTEEGLLTRRRVEIPLGKVQIVMVSEPILRRMMGYGTVSVETAALGFEEGRIRKAEATLPMVETGSLAALVATAVPSLTLDPWKAPLRTAHPGALLLGAAGGLLRAGFWATALAALAWGSLGAWAMLAFVLLPASLPVAWLDWRWQGWGLTDTEVVSRRGFLTRQTWVVSRSKIQSVLLVQGPVLASLGLARVLVRAAGSAVVLPLVKEAEAKAILARLVGT